MPEQAVPVSTGTRRLGDILSRPIVRDSFTVRIATSPEVVWTSLNEATWRSVPVSRLLMRVRAQGDRVVDPDNTFIHSGPVSSMLLDPPRYVAGAQVGQPWHRRPYFEPGIDSWQDLAAFSTPGFLRYGTEFEVRPSVTGTLLESTTVCEPTDAAAARSFLRYWRFIGPFSGLVRREMLHAVRRHAEDH